MFPLSKLRSTSSIPPYNSISASASGIFDCEMNIAISKDLIPAEATIPEADIVDTASTGMLILLLL